MQPISTAIIISANFANEQVCASAARISTTQGNAIEIFERSIEIDKNQSLINKVLQSGHRSFIEHATFTLALCNVSALVEQFFIEFRLASFTIKSRRYVDYSKMGYYVPPDLNGESHPLYIEHMDYLFSEYLEFINMGIPKEDARFVLPYSFYSNFYCTVNARELIYILREMKYGRGKHIGELSNLFNQIVAQLERSFPSVLGEIVDFTDNLEVTISPKIDNLRGELEEARPSSKLINCTSNTKELMQLACNISGRTEYDYSVVMHRPRELECVNATFLIQDLSLSGITHIVRHRVQSIIIPPYQKVKPYRYIVPQSVKDNESVYKRYRRIFEKNCLIIEKLRSLDFNDELYLCLSGNTLDVLTTMNARELMLFFKLRCCNRAQWEIREIAINMLHSLRASIPDIFNCMGPSCYTDGICPEGKLSCGKPTIIQQKFKNL